MRFGRSFRQGVALLCGAAWLCASAAAAQSDDASFQASANLALSQCQLPTPHSAARGVDQLSRDAVVDVPGFNIQGARGGTCHVTYVGAHDADLWRDVVARYCKTQASQLNALTCHEEKGRGIVLWRRPQEATVSIFFNAT